MSDEPLTATAMSMKMSAERNHVEGMIRRCVAQAMAEICPNERDDRAERVAYMAAHLAVEHTARSLADMQRIAETLAVGSLIPVRSIKLSDGPQSLDDGA